MSDTEPTPAELVTRWRTTADTIETSEVARTKAYYAVALRRCADELEAALKPRLMSAAELARVTEGLDECECGHGMSAHSTSGCLAPSPMGSYRPFCACIRRTVDDEYGHAVRWRDG